MAGKKIHKIGADYLIEMYIEKKKSIVEISKDCGISRSTVRNEIIRNNISLRTRSEGIKNSADKGLLGSGLLGKKRPLTTEWKNKIRMAKIRHGELFSKGVSLKQNGYVEITRGNDKGRLEHIVVMEKSIGRQIKPDECVHHVNHIRSDNRIENLILMTRKEHARHHATENLSKRTRYNNGRFK